MKLRLALLTMLSTLLPGATAPPGYHLCALPVPDDAPPQVRKEILRLRDASEVTRGYAAWELCKMAERAGPAVPFLRHLLMDDSPLWSTNSFGGARWDGPTCPGLLAAEALWAIQPAEITDVAEVTFTAVVENAGTGATSGSFFVRFELPKELAKKRLARARLAPLLYLKVRGDREDETEKIHPSSACLYFFLEVGDLGLERRLRPYRFCHFLEVTPARGESSGKVAKLLKVRCVHNPIQ